jgi:prepilin peptidase CpaA
MPLDPMLLSGTAEAAMLAAAAWQDARHQRIPNAVVLPGAAVALALSLMPGGVGIANALGGLAAGLMLLLPLYLMGVTGAGDVKLLAAVGAFTGMPGILGVALLAFVVGGALSLAWAIHLRLLRKVLANLNVAAFTTIAELCSGRLPNARGFPVSTARIPYAVAIAAGALIHALLAASGWRSVFS